MDLSVLRRATPGGCCRGERPGSPPRGTGQMSPWELAGNGVAGYAGDGGLATLAQLNDPSDVAVDSGGDIYIADTEHNRIRKVAAATGIISTIAGTGVYSYFGDGGLAVNARFRRPVAIGFDSADNLYIADAEKASPRMRTSATPPAGKQRSSPPTRQPATSSRSPTE